MIYIAVCDDSKSELRIIKSCFDKMKTKIVDEVNIKYYSSSKQLEKIVKNPYMVKHDIYILDIDMPEIDGLKLAAILSQWNPTAIIFFLTSHLEYATEGYKVKAVRYVYKEQMQHQLEEAVFFAIEQWKIQQQNSITITHYRDCYRIKHSDIIYVQRVGRQLEINIKDKPAITDNHSLGELYNLLNSPKFVFIERGCFVNIDYIYKITKRAAYLTTGKELTISRRLIAEIKSRITELWNESL